jgi:glycerophosphoryl diester phosphodiesterase
VDGQAFKLPIPQLQDVLQYAKEQELNLVLEIKNPRLYPEIANQVVELIVENEMQEQVIIIAFNAGSLKEVAQKYDEITLGYLQIYPLKIPKYPASKVVSVYWLSIMLDPTLIMRLHKQDFHVWIWTVDSKWLAKIALWKGVDGITTNQPDKRGSWGVP